MASPVVLPTTTTTTLNSQEIHIQNQTLPPQKNSPTSNNISHTPTNNNNNNNINNSSSNDNNNGSVNKKKRSLDQLNVSEKSPFLKIRAVVSELRPLILEVLPCKMYLGGANKAIKAPYLETCEARPVIEEKVKVIVDQYRQQQTQDPSQKQDGRLSLLLKKHLLTQEEKRLASQNSIAKPAQGKHKIPGSYIIGGSAFGWNFLMFQGTKPEYYGRTKEAFKAGQ